MVNKNIRNLKLIINKCFNVSFNKLACLVSWEFVDVFCLIFFTSSSDYDGHQTARGDSVRVGLTISLLIRFGDPLLEIWDAQKRTTIFFACEYRFRNSVATTSMVQITRVGQTSIRGSVMIVFDLLEGLGVELGVSSVKEGQ